MPLDAGSAKGYLDLDISGFLKNLKKAQDEADKSTKSMGNKIADNMSNVGTKLSSVGSTLTKTVTLPLLGVGAAGLKTAADFEKGMSKVKAISQASESDFKKLRSAAMQWGADTSFSASEVADAMTEMAKAGWDTQKILDGMEGVLDATAASGESLGAVATIVADAITGFGLAASDATKVADLLTQAANAGTIDINDLGESFKYIAPVAGALGLSIEEVTTAVSAMSMAGIKGSQAGTSLRSVLTRLVKPTKESYNAMKALGIEVSNSDGSFKSLDEIISVMRKSFSGLTEEQKGFYAAQLAGQEGMSGLLSLLNLTEEEYNEISKSMKNATGVADETAAVMKDNLAGKVEELTGSLETLAIKMSDLVIPALKDMADKAVELVNKFSELDPKTQKSILKFGALAISIGPALSAFGKMSTGLGSFINFTSKIPGGLTKVKKGFDSAKLAIVNFGEAQQLAQAGFPGLASQSSKLYGIFAKLAPSAAASGASIASVAAPVIAVVAVIGLLIAAFVSLYKNNEKFKNSIDATWGQIKKTFDDLGKGIVERLNALGFEFESITDVFKAIWKAFTDYLAPLFKGVFNQIAIAFETWSNVFLGILDIFVGIFTGDWDRAWGGVKQIFESIFTGIQDTFVNIWNTFRGVWDVALGWVGSSWDKLWTDVGNFFTNAWNSILQFFKDLPYNIGYYLGLAIGKVYVWATELPAKAKEAASNFLNNVTIFFESLPARFTKWLNDTITKLKAWKDDMGKKGKEGAESFFNNLKSFFDNLPEKLKQIGKDIIEGIWKGIESMKQWFKDKFNSFFSGFTAGITVGTKGKSSSAKSAKAASFSIKDENPDISPFNMPRNSPSPFAMFKSAANSFKGFTRDVVNKGVEAFGNSFGFTYWDDTYNNKPDKQKKEKESNVTRYGDTFIFNSPKKIDEVEAARRLRKTKRDLLEGF